MEFIKKIGKTEVILIAEKIETINEYTIYQISEIIDGVKTKLYKECFTDYDIKLLAKKGFNYTRWIVSDGF